MNARNLATVLWFFAGWSCAGLVFGLMGLPSVLAVLAAVGPALLIRWDPSGLLWTKAAPAGRRVRPIEEVAAELDERTRRTAGAENTNRI